MSFLIRILTPLGNSEKVQNFYGPKLFVGPSGQKILKVMKTWADESLDWHCFGR